MCVCLVVFSFIVLLVTDDAHAVPQEHGQGNERQNAHAYPAQILHAGIDDIAKE